MPSIFLRVRHVKVHEKSLLLALAPASLLIILPPLPQSRRIQDGMSFISRDAVTLPPLYHTSFAIPGPSAGAGSSNDIHISIPFLWFQVLGSFTMYPLFVKDKLVLPYFALSVFYLAVPVLLALLLRHSDDTDKVALHDGRKLRPTLLAQLFGVEPFLILSCIGMNEEISRRQNTFVTSPLLIMTFTGMTLLHVAYFVISPPARYPDLLPTMFSLFGAANLAAAYIYAIYLLYNGSEVDCDASKTE